jgi:hypothetical protein
MPAIKGDGPDFHPAVMLLVALLALATLLPALAPETFTRPTPASELRASSAG